MKWETSWRVCFETAVYNKKKPIHADHHLHGDFKFTFESRI